ncbi:hypothetical protein L6452_29048 [Arctium lappa]|uniref:Uncharacterized protein n=1 Tax=Arctium lappa TaxID=4217 RepID=A0ACB8ZFX0_ARCLA|nr:hypothetical protein L6452_29048 [Arctium lappa]
MHEINPTSANTRIDNYRLAAIKHRLNTILPASITPENTNPVSPQYKDVKSTGLIGASGNEGTTTAVEPRLHQLLLSVQDFDVRPVYPPGISLGTESDGDQEGERASVSIENCGEKGYSIVTVQREDRTFGTVCTLADIQYDSTQFHGLDHF